MDDRGILIVVSGFSGAGKGTITRMLRERYDCYALSISVTTRQPRNGEKEGTDYFFRTREEFLSLIEEEKLYEYAEYQGMFYGTPRSYVDECLNRGLDVILEIDVQGAEQIKKKFPDTVLVFVSPPDIPTLLKRLKDRGTETEDKIRGRMLRAAEEAFFIPGYDYLLINDELEASIEKLHQIARAEHMRCSRSRDKILQLGEEIRDLSLSELETGNE